MPEKTATQRLEDLNRLRKLAGQPELKTWKKSRALLEQRITELLKSLNMSDVTDPNNGAPGETPVLTDWNLTKVDLVKDEDSEQFGNVAQFPSRLKKPVQNPELPAVKLRVPFENTKKKVGEDMHRERAAKVIIPMIRDGLTNDQIFNKLMAEQPEIICVEIDGELMPTKRWYIGWFRGDVKWQDSCKKHKAQSS